MTTFFLGTDTLEHIAESVRDKEPLALGPDVRLGTEITEFEHHSLNRIAGHSHEMRKKAEADARVRALRSDPRIVSYFGDAERNDAFAALHEVINHADGRLPQVVEE